MTDYRHDVYVGFAGGGHVERWVRNHLAPELRDWLHALDADPWALHLAPAARDAAAPAAVPAALEASRLVVAVWSPEYFASARCVAEWEAVLARERALGMASVDDPHTLLHPVAFAAPERFPAGARSRRWHDFVDLAIPHAAFRDAPEYLQFSARVRALAEVLCATRPRVPPWPPGAASG